MEAFPWGWCVSLGLGADHSLPSNAKVKNGWICTSSSSVWVLGVYNDSFTLYLQCAARLSVPHTELAHVGRFTVFTQKSCKLFVLFKGCLGRIHENGHQSSSDCSCYDFKKNCSSNEIDVQRILWHVHDSYKCKTLVTKICSCDSWGNTAQEEVLLSYKLNVEIGLAASWVVNF